MNEPAPVPQRALIVLPSTAEFDSRTWRIATTLVARGHAVTVLARWAPGLARDERVAGGYRVVRVPVSSVDGLPVPRWARDTIARTRQRRAGRPSTPPVSTRDAADPGVAAVSPAGVPTPSPADAPTAPRVGPGARVARAIAAVRRIAAIALTVRSQGRATVAVAPDADLVHGMAYMGIPVALAVGRRVGAPVVYDARDIYLDAGNLARLPRPARSVVGARERRWARAADRVVTVNVPYAEVMAERWELPLPLVVLNCAYRTAAPETLGRRFHERLDLPPDARVVLYQGGFSSGRGIEQLIEAIRAVPGAILVLLGYGYLLPAIERLAAAPDLVDPRLGPRVRILPAVPPTELLDWVACADVVAMPIQPTTLNHRLTTPNKLFEAMAVGVPVVASDLPGMAPIVRETGCGVVCDPTDPAAIAAAVREILDAPPAIRAAYRSRALAAAHATYCWEHQVEALLAEYGRLTGRPW
jgi:glycosyltransferase involved in cell wall biosynthesis